MARGCRTDEGALRLLREVEGLLASGNDVTEACRRAGIGGGTYESWRRMSGGVSRSRLVEKRALETEKTRLKTIVAELEPDQLILKKSLHF